MADYLRFVCEPMWNLIDSEKGYYPVDPNNLTPSEVFDRHLNLATIGFLKRGMDELTRAPFLHITNAKEMWDTLLIAKSGTGSLQMTRYETAKNALHNLHMKKDESPPTTSYAPQSSLRSSPILHMPEIFGWISNRQPLPCGQDVECSHGIFSSNGV